MTDRSELQRIARETGVPVADLMAQRLADRLWIEHGYPSDFAQFLAADQTLHFAEMFSGQQVFIPKSHLFHVRNRWLCTLGHRIPDAAQTTGLYEKHIYKIVKDWRRRRV